MKRKKMDLRNKLVQYKLSVILKESSRTVEEKSLPGTDHDSLGPSNSPDDPREIKLSK